MNKNRKTLLWLILVALVAVTGYWGWRNNQEKTSEEKEVIKIGAILPLTGDLAKYGESGKEGLDIALQHFRENYPEVDVNVIVEDDKGTSKAALNAVKKLIQIDQVDIIVGSMSSGVTLGIAPEMNKNKVALVAPTSTASNVTEAGDYIFRVCVSDALEGHSMAQYIHNQFPNKRIAVVYINNDYGVGLKNNFLKSCRQLGIDVKFEIGYLPDNKNFRSVISSLRKEGIDLLYIVAQKEQIDFFSQCQEMNFKPQITGSTMLEDYELLGRLGEYLDGAVYSYRNYDPLGTDVVSQKFVDEYKKIYDKTPDFYAASTYDATKVALLAKLKSIREETLVKDALNTLEDIPCVTGIISFDDNGDVTHGFGIKTIKDREFHYILRDL